MSSPSSSLRIREPAVAGAFYPGDPGELEATVRGHLEAAGGDPERDPGAPAKALIAPHAGYVYSGPVAASAYQQLVGLDERIRRVVLLGPSHRVAHRGLATSSAHAFATPLGRVRVDRECVEQLESLPQVRQLDAAHAAEHSLEVQLPFLQCVLGDFELVPLSVGDATLEEVRAVLDAAWGGEETLVVVSSDLSHYHDYGTALSLDRETTQAIEELRPEGLGTESACGRVPTRGLLAAARQRGLSARTLDVRSSGDTAGSHDRVVGYGAWAFEPRPPLAAGSFNARERRLLVDVAWRSLAEGVETGQGLVVSVAKSPPRLRESRASFVTLRIGGELRGCIGSVQASRPLVVDVAAQAFAAAFRDPRFAPLTAAELPRLDVEISVLSPSAPLAFDDEEDVIRQMRPGEDGLVFEAEGRRGVLLPSVWESLPEPRVFLQHLKRKAGLPEDYWSPDVRVSRFGTEQIASPRVAKESG